MNCTWERRSAIRAMMVAIVVDVTGPTPRCRFSSPRGVGQSYEAESNYLRVYLAPLRRKLEPEPSQPKYLLTEPGMGLPVQS